MANKKISVWLKLCLFSFFVLPASSNYKMEGFSFGNAGGGGIGSSNYSVQGNVGEVSNNKIGSSNYDLGAGLEFIRQSSTPRAPTLVNDGNYYNKLHITLDNTYSGGGSTNFPTDTKFAVAISKNNWATTEYVKSDMTVGTSLTITDYLPFSSWGSSSGINIIGLDVGTSYSVKVKSMQGRYSESGYGSTAASSTINPSLTFGIGVSDVDALTSPPYLIDLGSLFPGSVVTSSNQVWVHLDTNANSGASVFVYGTNGGLKSIAAGYTISAVSGDLSVLSTGFGAQGVGATQTAGGPFSIDVGYTGSGSVVGITDTSVRQLFISNNPVSAGTASFLIKAKSDNSAPAAGDYSETLTIMAAANF